MNTIERKSHSLKVEEQGQFVKVILVLPGGIYSDIVSDSMQAPDRFAYERSRINAFIQEIFNESHEEILTWTTKDAFSQFLKRYNLSGDSQFWFKTAYIKISDKRPFVNQYTIYGYADELSYKFELQYLFSDLIRLRDSIIKADSSFKTGRTALEFSYLDYRFTILKSFNDAIGIQVCYAPRGMIITKSFFDQLLSKSPGDLILLEDYIKYEESRKTSMIKVTWKDFSGSFQKIKQAVQYDMAHSHIGEKSYWENRHLMK